jgi:formate/nitrite transporter
MSETPLKYLVDAYAPAEMARRVLDVGVAKARLAVPDALGLGAAFATLAMTQTGMGFGPTRVLGGVAFSLGLILVVVAGAELFTGNNLVAMAWASRAIQTRQMVRNWLLVYVGNFVGAMGTVFLVFWTRTWTMADGRFGLNALQIAAAKCDIGFVEAFARGVLCNALVCLAVWLCQSARSTTDKILAIIWPIAGFVALGFEHSIANMYFIPFGILLKRWRGRHGHSHAGRLHIQSDSGDTG